MSSLTTLVSRHPILHALASFLSTVDLFHLALANRTHYSHILASRATFDTLRCDCLCDGRGLAKRQQFLGKYSLERRSYVWGKERKIWQDEPIEVGLYNTKCDEVGALPCRKCGINICEECRYYQREPSRYRFNGRRPHLNASLQICNVMCLCADCDAKVESEEVQGKFLNELCDCDTHTRWICEKCVDKEYEFTSHYYKNYAAHEWGDQPDNFPEDTKGMADHGHCIEFMCLCGASVPDDARPRCCWCKRKHLPEKEWYNEWNNMAKMRICKSDPCYPTFPDSAIYDNPPPPYPRLAYKGPIWKVPEKQE